MTLVTLILTLFACPTAPPEESGGSVPDCPTQGYTETADLPCDCAGEVVTAMPNDCGYAECTDEGMIYFDVGCDTGGGCKGVDCG